MGLFEVSPEVRLGLIVGNTVASLSSVATAMSDLITGETNDIGSLTISDSSFQYSHETMVGRDSLTSGALSGLGWASPIGLTSAPLQAAAVFNDLGLLYFGPFAEIPKSIPIRKEEGRLDWE